MAPSSAEVLDGIVASSPLASLYTEALDRESAYEKLTGEIAAGPGTRWARRSGQMAVRPGHPPAPQSGVSEAERLEQEIRGTSTPTVPVPAPEPPARKSRSRTAEPPAAERRRGEGARLQGRRGFPPVGRHSLAREITRGMFGTRRR